MQSQRTNVKLREVARNMLMKAQATGSGARKEKPALPQMTQSLN